MLDALASRSRRDRLLPIVVIMAVAAAVSDLPGPWPDVLVAAVSIAVLLRTRERLLRGHQALREAALSDPLTGVANRRLLLSRAEYEIARHTRDRRSFALVMIDLDGFKALNDRFGHPAGDEILCDVSASVSSTLRGQDTLARLGGDEFCVLAPLTDHGGVVPLAHRIDRAIAGATSGVEVLSASLGVAVFPQDGISTQELLEIADERLLAAKRRHRAGARPGGRARAA
ncbi:MAG TPA: GGDEF domain-containing protein [Solirubrobacteraceae bacterium]|nr:GGDEF domain-containing protein [Solirubrobacteraceae bacterium]